jgi:hypothetical protein
MRRIRRVGGGTVSDAAATTGSYRSRSASVTCWARSKRVMRQVLLGSMMER